MSPGTTGFLKVKVAFCPKTTAMGGFDKETFRCTAVFRGCPAVFQATSRVELCAQVLEHMISAHQAILKFAPLMEKAQACFESSKDWEYYQDWSSRRIDFLIVTALEKEFAPLSKVFKGTALPKESGDPNHYETAEISATKFKYSIRLLCVGDQGPVRTAAVLATALKSLIPRYVIMTGIAATVPGEGRRVGDVLVATHLVDVSGHKVWPTRTEVRNETYSCDSELRREIQGFVGKNKKWGRLARIGAVISQTDLVKSAAHRDRLVALVKKANPGLKPIGIEKEGAGVAISADVQTRAHQPGILMVKGAVDFANYQKSDKAQQKAARHAAQFLHAFLSAAPVGVLLCEAVKAPGMKGNGEREHIYNLFQEFGDRRLLCHGHGTWEYPKAIDSVERMRASITKALARLGPDWGHRKLLEDARTTLQNFETLLEREMQQVGWESVPPLLLTESVNHTRGVVREKFQALAEIYSLIPPDNLR